MEIPLGYILTIGRICFYPKPRADPYRMTEKIDTILYSYFFYDLTVSLIFHGYILAVEYEPHDDEEEPIESEEVVRRNSKWS